MSGFEYIKTDELLTCFNDAKKFMSPLFAPFDEYERIARNRPHPGIDKNLPKVTDGTLAALIQEEPKRVIQQIPTGGIKTQDKQLDIYAKWILEHEILPNADEEAKFIAKCWIAISKSKTYGSQPAFVKFLNRGEYFGTDFVLPYIKDVLLEPGKVSDRASNVIMLRTWWSKNQLQALIAKEEKLAGSAKDRGDDYEGTWDLEMLADLLEAGPGQKDQRSQTPSERTKQLSNGVYEIVHVFQRGIGANFYAFAPKLDDGDNVLRTRTNPDPRGIIPIHYLYADQDLSNPLGRGAVEMSGGLQNLLDSEVQMYQQNRALMLNPPMKKWGNTSKSAIKFVPNHIIELNGDKNSSDVEALIVDSTALNNFEKNFGLIKSEILNLNNSLDTSISSASGNPGYSKTPQGVKAQDDKLNIGDNFVRNQFESWFEEITETALNLYFAERHGVQELQVDDDTADLLQAIDPSVVSEDNMIRINYDEEYPKLKFKVDPMSSRVQEDMEQVQALQEVLAETSKNPYIPYLLQSEGKELHVGEVYAQLFERLGVQNLDKIITDIETDPQTGQPKPPSVMTPFFDKPSVSATFKDLPPAAQVQLLANGGINIQESDVLQPNIEQIAGGKYQNPVKPAYVDPQTGYIVSGHPPQPGIPYVDPGTGQPVEGQPQNDITQHPIVQMMSALNIKFETLPPDVQSQLVTELFGITPTQPSTTQAETLLKTQNQQHQQALDAANIDLKSRELAVKEQAQGTDQAHKAAEFGRSGIQADRSHQLAVKQASQPKPGATK